MQDFIAHRPADAERRWGRMERDLPTALAAVRNGDTAGNSRIADLLKNLMALHWARSAASLEVNKRLRKEVLAQSMARQASSPQVLDALFYRKTGLVSAGAESRWIANHGLHSRAPELFDQSWFESTQRHFDMAREKFDRYSIQVGRAPAVSDFILGDVPVITPGPSGLAQHQGTALMDAYNVAMPVGPKAIVALGPVEVDTTLTTAEVAEGGEDQQPHPRSVDRRPPSVGTRPRAEGVAHPATDVDM